MSESRARSRHVERAIALAGVFQAAALADQAARRGSAEQAPLEASVESVFRIDTESADQVFGGIDGVRLGLVTLLSQLGARGRRELSIMRYAATLMVLERALVREPEMLARIRDGVAVAAQQAELHSSVHENVMARLADVYVDTVSKLSPRIIVMGEPGYLQDADNANRIRAVLLCGIRAAVMWHQLGGNRLQLLLFRRRLVDAARALLAEPAEGGAAP